jgi:hypothetical protein
MPSLAVYVHLTTGAAGPVYGVQPVCRRSWRNMGQGLSARRSDAQAGRRKKSMMNLAFMSWLRVGKNPKSKNQNSKEIQTAKGERRKTSNLSPDTFNLQLENGE